MLLIDAGVVIDSIDVVSRLEVTYVHFVPYGSEQGSQQVVTTLSAHCSPPRLGTE